jgi:hypothetical protein
MSGRPVPVMTEAERAEERALAKLKGMALRLNDDVKSMQLLTKQLPLAIRIECNNVMECLDLLRHRLQEETLRRVIGEPIEQGKLRRPAAPRKSTRSRTAANSQRS